MSSYRSPIVVVLALASFVVFAEDTGARCRRRLFSGRRAPSPPRRVERARVLEWPPPKPPTGDEVTIFRGVRYESERELLGKIDPGVVYFGVPREFGRKHPHIVIADEPLDWDDEDGWYHFVVGDPHPSGRGLNRAFLMLGAGDISVGRSNWRDPDDPGTVWTRTPITGQWIKTQEAQR